MVKHIVFWKLKENAAGQSAKENAEQIKQKLEALNNKIPGTIKIEVGINFLSSDSNFDVALYSEFESKEALELYQEHPLHQAILPFVRAVVTDRKAVDYEI